LKTELFKCFQGRTLKLAIDNLGLVVLTASGHVSLLKHLYVHWLSVMTSLHHLMTTSHHLVRCQVLRLWSSGEHTSKSCPWTDANFSS